MACRRRISAAAPEMPRELQPCAVCATVDAKYACPKCRAAYCCVACCKRHKESGDCGGASSRRAPATTAPLERKKAVAAKEEVCCDDDETNVLTDAHKERLSGCGWLRDELRSEPTLRALLVKIEGAREPSTALATARSNDTRFADFVDRMLVELGICAFEADGSIAFHGPKRPIPAPDTGKPPEPIYHNAAEHNSERIARLIVGSLSEAQLGENLPSHC